MKQKVVMQRDEMAEFISNVYGGDLHAKRVLDLPRFRGQLMAFASV